MNYEDLTQEVKDKLLSFTRTNGETSEHRSLVLKDKTVAPKFYNIENELHIDLLIEDFKREYYPAEYKLEADARSKQFAQERELKEFNSAKAIESKDYSGYLFYNEDWYDEVSDFIEQFLENYDEEEFIAEQHLPKFLWGSKPLKINYPDFESIVERMYGDASSWDESPIDSLKGVKEFKLALDKFYKDNEKTSWFERDNKVAVMLTLKDFDYANQYWAALNDL